MKRRFDYYVYAGIGGMGSSTGDALLGAWRDGPMPRFSYGLDGTGELTVTLPRRVGMRDDASEGGSGTLKYGNRVDVYVADDYTLRTSLLGKLIYRGTIEDVTGFATVTILPLNFIYEGQYTATAANTTDDTLEAAQQFLLQYGGAVPWDMNNPKGSGVTISLSFETATLMPVLRACADATGPNWHCFVGREGTVRFADDTSLAATVHKLTHGRNCLVDLDRLKISSVNMAHRVLLFYTDPNGIKQQSTSTSDRWNSDFPRDLVKSWPNKISKATGDALAAAMLRDLDRVAIQAEVTVVAADYDIESIDIGHTVELQIPRTYPLASVSQADGEYNVLRVRIARIQYEGYRVVLSLDTPPQSMARELARAAVEQQQFAITQTS